MQAKTLALKSCSANQRWCNVGTKTTVPADEYGTKSNSTDVADEYQLIPIPIPVGEIPVLVQLVRGLVLIQRVRVRPSTLGLLAS